MRHVVCRTSLFRTAAHRLQLSRLLGCEHGAVLVGKESVVVPVEGVATQEETTRQVLAGSIIFSNVELLGQPTLTQLHIHPIGAEPDDVQPVATEGNLKKAAKAALPQAPEDPDSGDDNNSGGGSGSGGDLGVTE